MLLGEVKEGDQANAEAHVERHGELLGEEFAHDHLVGLGELGFDHLATRGIDERVLDYAGGDVIREAIGSKKPGDVVPVVVRRDGASIKVNVTLEVRR